jgi:hypothetical protein
MSELGNSFWSKVEKTDACWNWVACKRPDGYGFYKAVGKTRSAHRISYADAYGPIPSGMVVDHRCFNKSCVRPSHLRLATNKQNGENRQGPTKANKSGVRGVHWHAGKQRWIASVRHRGRLVNVGTFRDLAEADAAVTAKRLELFTHNDSDRLAS